MNTLRINASVFASQKYGGVSRYLVELARGVAFAKDWSVTVDACCYCNEYLRQARSDVGHRGIYFERRPRGLAEINRLACGLTHLIRRSKVSVIHEGFFDARSLSKDATARVATFYDMISERFMHDQRHLVAKKETAKAADRLIAISESTKADMVEILGIAPEKIEVIYLGASISHPQNQPATNLEFPYVLWVGNRDGYKNFGRLIDAMGKSRLARQEFGLVCAGGPPFQASELSAWEQEGLSLDRLRHRRPNEAELAALYQGAEMLVYISRYEGFGIPPLEAMQCGCPVIASDTSSIPEVVGDAALIVDPGDTCAVSSALDQLGGDTSLRHTLVERGFQQASRFTWEQCVRRHLSLYQELIA